LPEAETMGLFSMLFHEFVDVIEWTDDSDARPGTRTMVYRFERYGNEIKYGAKLIVRETQVAVFVNEGQVADVLGPGTYELETKNLPVLTTLQNWHHGFKSPFKAEVYFLSMRRFTDLKWGTKQPLMLRDPEFGGLRVRAFGTYGTRITEPLTFVREIVGTEGVFTTDEISDQLRNLITSRFASIIGGSSIPVLDMAANYDQLGEFLTTRIAPEFEEYGLELTRVLVENISLPPKVAEALDERTSRGMTGNLDDFLKYQTGEAMTTAAANPGGGAAAAGVGMGVGMAMADRIAKTGETPAGSSRQPPAPPSADDEYFIEVDGEADGPHSPKELERRIQAGTLASETLVWSDGMSGWRAASEVAEIATLFESAARAAADVAARRPPPLPPR